MSDFDPAYPLTINYINKSRRYYREKRFNNPYRWATYADVPFTPMANPLSASCIGLICTASLDEASVYEKQAYAASASLPPESLYTMRVFWHKNATHTDRAIG